MADRPAPSIGALRGAVDLAPLVARQNREAQAARRPADDTAADQPQSNLVFEIAEADFGQAVELSKTVPVLVALVATWSTPSQDLLVSLRRAVEAAAGRLVLAIVDADASPRIAQAFQAQSVPTTVALVAGGPVPLFAGVLPDDQLGPLLDQVLELAAQHGVTGSVPQDGQAQPAPVEPEPAPLPPLHAEAYDAIDRGDYADAARLFRTAIAQDPRDAAAVAALAQVELLERLQHVQPDTTDPLDLADLDLSEGRVDEAFERLLTAFGTAAPDDRTVIRTRLLDYFTLTGTDDPRVVAARRRLAALLY